MSAYVIHATGMISEDGKQLLIDYPDQLKADYVHLAGYAITIEIRKQRSKRSLAQNSWLHAAIKPLADHIGSKTEELKLDLLGLTFGWQDTPRGAKLPNIMRTADLNTEQFGELMDTLLEEAAKEGVVILLPDEFRREKKKQLRRGTGQKAMPGGNTAAVVGHPDGATPSAASLGNGR